MFVEDFIDVFYSFDLNNWAASLEIVLQMLNFPVHLEYSCEWEEYLYERSGLIKHLRTDDRKLLAECQGIAMFRMGGVFRKLKLASVMLTGNPRLRNEKVYRIYKLFRKLYGRHVFFVACFDGDIAFVGTAVYKRKKSEVIISDWFGEKTNQEMMSRILDIDFAFFSYDNLGEMYRDYLWAISRPYVRYKESKIYLTYECGHIVTYESFATLPDGEGTTLVTKVDRKETLRINSSYYPEMYGDDYFEDDSKIEDDTFDIPDSEDTEFEWTMLEMELAKELDEDDYYDNDYEDEVEDDQESDDGYEKISGMNPEEMLEYIRGE